MTENRSVEVSAADIEDAIQQGLAELRVSRESVIVEILEEPSRGFLGMGSRQALVRLTTAARPYSSTPIEEDEEEEDSPPPPATPTPTLFSTNRAVPEEDIPEELQIGRTKLAEMLKLMDVEAEVVVEYSPLTDEDSDPMILQVKGEDLSYLIGRKGETLNALQYVLRLIASRDLERRADFVVDVGEYKSRRSDKLYNLAHRMADQAVSRKRTLHLEPMPPHERRIIHMALREREDVETSSVGEGAYRKVTIIPQKTR